MKNPPKYFDDGFICVCTAHCVWERTTNDLAVESHTQIESQKLTNQIKSQSSVCRIESGNCRITPNKCTNRNLNPNRDWDLPHTGLDHSLHGTEGQGRRSMSWVRLMRSVRPQLRAVFASCSIKSRYGHIFVFFNNSVKIKPIWIIFGIQNPEEVLHKCFEPVHHTGKMSPRYLVKCIKCHFQQQHQLDMLL